MLTLLTLLRSQYAAENLQSAKFVKPDNSFGIIVQPTITIRLGITIIYILRYIICLYICTIYYTIHTIQLSMYSQVIQCHLESTFLPVKSPSCRFPAWPLPDLWTRPRPLGQRLPQAVAVLGNSIRSP